MILAFLSKCIVSVASHAVDALRWLTGARTEPRPLRYEELGWKPRWNDEDPKSGPKKMGPN